MTHPTAATSAPSGSSPAPTLAPSPGPAPYDFVAAFSQPKSFGDYVESALTSVSIGLCTYHGYKRNNDSLGWALGWGFLGGMFPIVAPAIAFAQGLGKSPEEKARFAALGTDENTECLEPHVRALCYCEGTK